MINYKNYIKDEIKRILNTSKDIVVEIPPKDNMGDYSVPCFELRNEELNNPVMVANKLKDEFNDKEKYFDKIDVMGPYLNFYLDKEILVKETINAILSNEKYGSLNQGNGEELLIEHTSINPNAEPHMGRSRNTFIGDFMSNLFGFTGYKVSRHYFINDLGKKIALLLIGVEKYGLKSNSFKDILDVYVKINKDAKEDENLDKQAFDYLELVESGNPEWVAKFKNLTDMCVKGQMEIFDLLDVHFDEFTHESDYVYNNYLSSILDKLKEKGKLCVDELGRNYVDLTGYDIPTKEPVLVLTRSNGTSLYPIKDIAYSMHKIDLNDKNNYIVLGEDQEVYMQQIAATLDILGKKAPKLISYSYVLLNGEKMGTSTGITVLVSDFIRIIKEKLIESFKERNITPNEETLMILTNACIKYEMLNVYKHKIVDFNIESATSFNGESGLYILYSIVRINSILRQENNKVTNDEVKFVNDIELKIIKDLYNFPTLVDNLLTTQEPSQLTKYIYGLTQKFSKFYEEVNVTNETDEVLKSSRIKLLNAIKIVLTNGLSILGIKTIDKM